MHLHLRVGFSNLSLLLSLIASGASATAADPAAFCQAEITKIEGNASSLADTIQRMEKIRGQCQGTGLYEYHLSKFYGRARDYTNAERSIADGLGHDTPYNQELMLAKGDILLHQHKYAEAEKMYREVIARYPEWYAGFDYLGFSLFAQGKNKEAVKYLNAANALQEQADTYRTLTLAHYLLGDWKQSIESLNRAFSLDPGIASDRDPMVAGIRSYAEVGKFEVSRNLLAMLLSSDPGIKNDPEFIKAGFFVRKKMVDAGLIAE